MSEVAIRVSHLSKLYRIGEAEQRHETLLGAALSYLRSPISNFRNLRKLTRFEDVAPEISDQKSEVRDQQSETRDQRTEGRSQRSEIGSQTSEVSPPTSESAPLTSDLRPLTSGKGLRPLTSGKDLRPLTSGKDLRPLTSGKDLRPLTSERETPTTDNRPLRTDNGRQATDAVDRNWACAASLWA